MRGAANPDHAFWSKPVDAAPGWMEGLSSDEPDTAETQALDDLAAGRNASTDRVFHELRDISIAAPADTDVGSGGDNRDGGTDDPDDPLPPAATTADFDFDAVSDDLLPSWDLDLG